MGEAIQIPRFSLPPGGRYGLAFLFSVCINAAILWLVAHYLLKTDDYSAPPQPKTIHLQLSPAKERQTEPIVEQRPPTPSAAERPKTSNRNSEPQPAEEQATVSEPSSSTEKQPPVNSARILATARDMAHQMAAEDKTKPQQTAPLMPSALESALNPKREPASVEMLADGTIRVVTEFGLVYCIRSQDDSRILGPEDDLPMSMTCR
ncbi:MAG: hypothetical protein KZQ77_11780 [Candidatus Thiodiazotropha sp. (ex Notomyrtea botanica)]|nr:hypothetical protein [Candidatus Thiodiazotropha sp. (ex Notomyrtea botanica)]